MFYIKHGRENIILGDDTERHASQCNINGRAGVFMGHRNNGKMCGIVKTILCRFSTVSVSRVCEIVGCGVCN